MAVTSDDATIAATDSSLTRDQLHDIYYYLQLTRQLENVLTNLYRQNKVIGGLYRSLGQEAIAVASAYALERRSDGTGDVISPAIRNLGGLLVMGARPVDVLRQYMAKGDSPTWGREQNVHFTDYDNGFIGLISHLGVMIGVMAGAALTFKLRREPRIALVWSGDGMTSTGGFHEGLNLAAVQKAPLIVIVENNGYAYSTPVARQTAAKSFVERAQGYGVFGEQCDGNDVFAVYDMVRRAAERARSGEGTSLLEVMTYRRKGHAEHDAQAYVPAGEVERWEAKDPVTRYEQTLLARGLATQQELDAIVQRATSQVEDAREEAERSPMPDAETALCEVTGGSVTVKPWTRHESPDPHLA